MNNSGNMSETKALKLVRVLEELDINRDGYMEQSYLVFMKEGGMVGN